VYTPYRPQPPLAPHAGFNTLPYATDPIETTPYTIFSGFFSNVMLEKIVKNTNAYANEHCAQETRQQRGEGRSWTALTVDELRVWFGIAFLMGVTVEPWVKDYWRPNDGINSYHPFTEFMSLLRYEQIKRFIHITDPHRADQDTEEDCDFENPQPHTWTCKVDWLLQHLQSCSQGFRTIGTHASIDEAMIQNTRRSAHKYFMRHKPIPEGYKFFVLAEGGYVYNFYPETPVPKARLPLEPRPHQPQYVFSRTSEIVLHLLRSLPFRNHYFEIAMDNYFTNLLLFQFLRDELHMGAYGTLM
jgi:hypothetical protein